MVVCLKIGIDLGTINACVSHIDEDGKSQMIPND